ncbi:MAG TPA: hypothetical protein EYO33_29865 [Phycisphaerales bacterium]|nr:hypothetical protein [Phycisphaerales bacterium]
MDSGVEQYVQGLIAEGGAKETLGFTLDQARALKKLSKSQLPDEALWIVKMVQAAVRGEATEVDIRLGRNKVEVSFDSQKLPTALKLFEQVRSGQLSKDPFLLHLTTGIRTSFAGEGVSFLIQVVGPDGKDVVALSEGETHHIQDPDSRSQVARLTYVIRRPYRMVKLGKALDSHVTHLLKGTAAEHMELLTRCWASPVPLRIDGKLMDCRYDSPLMFRSSMTSLSSRQNSRNAVTPSVNCYLRYYPPEPGRPCLKVDGYSPGSRKEVRTTTGEAVWIRKPLYLNDRFMEWQYEEDTAGRVLISPMGRGRRTALYFVQDGAMVQRVPILLTPPLSVLGVEMNAPRSGGDCLIVAVGFEDLDLSQFAVKDVEERRIEELRWLKPHVIACSDAFIGHVSDFVPMNCSESRAKGGLALAGLATLPVGWSFGLIGVGAYAFYQSFFAGLTFASKKGVQKLYKAGYSKDREKLQALEFTDLEQPPI